jgi:hypothetical protein
MATNRQYLSLLAILVVGLALSGLAGGERTLAPAHWPASDSVYEVDGWSMQPAIVEADANPQQSLAIVQRAYWRAGENPATFVLWTQPQPQAKTLLRKGPDRDFLGAGYTSAPAPAELAASQPGRGALIARRGDDDAWLVLYTYGDRRGLVSMDLMAWVFAESDAFFDLPNDYFLARILVPFNASVASPPIAQATSLADVLFPRLASWYRELH